MTTTSARFVLATFNRDKARELEALLAVPGLSLVALADFPGATAPEESGATLLENARIKAAAAARHTGLAAIADDTGLEVDALDGAPGVHAARFAGSTASYEDNVRLMLERLSAVPLERRTARFRTVCVAVLEDGTEVVGEGALEGRITLEPRGTHGFGYDPVFELSERGLTLAEMSAADKNAVSHRGRAARALAQALRTRLLPLLLIVTCLGPAAEGVASETFVTPVLIRRQMGLSVASRLGESVAAGDLDRDGVPDLVAGAPGAPDGGKVEVYSGINGQPLLTLVAPGSGGRLGAEVDVIGDATGDGIPDLLVADPAQKTAYVFSGVDGSPIPLAPLPYEVDLDAGRSMDGVGDTNGDGHADFVIARRGLLHGADVFSGASGDLLASFLPEGSESVHGAATTMGDLDGDGIPEVAIAFPFSTGVFSAATGQRLFTLPIGDTMGAADIDGDGLSDLLINQGPDVFVFPSATRVVADTVRIAGQTTCCYYRVGIARLGDVDGDGIDDFAAALGTADDGAPGGGSVSVFSGATRLRLARIDGTAQDQGLGWDVFGPGDVDGDGVPDLLVGVPGALDPITGARTGALELYRLHRGPAPIEVDILPSRCPNVIATRGNQPIEVALFGAPGLDLSDIDPTSVRLADVPAVRERRRVMDLGSPSADPCACGSQPPDALGDRVFKFEAAAVRTAAASSPDGRLSITATLRDGRRIAGSDCAVLEAAVFAAVPQPTDNLGNPATASGYQRSRVPGGLGVGEEVNVRRGIITAAAVAYAVMLEVQSEAGQKPNPRFSDMDPNIVVCPAGDSLFRIISRDNLAQTTANNGVIVDFCGCPGVVFGPTQSADGYILDGCRTIGVTSMYGVIDFNWRAGGVCNGAVTIHLDGIPFPTRAYVASTDQNGDLIVTQADVDAVTAKLGGTDLTADLDGDLGVTPSDVAVVQAHLGHSVEGTVDVPPSTPIALRLYAAIPNPARAETVIPFDLPRRGAVTMEAFDASGRRVRELLGAWMLPAGNHRVTWDGRDFAGARVAPGVYFIRVRAGGERRFGRITRVQ